MRYPIAGSKTFYINELAEVFDSNGNRVEESLTAEGRPRVYLYIDKDYKWAWRQVDRIMLDTFKPYDGNTDMFSVKHLDGNECNNHISNLEWDATLFRPPVIPGIGCPIDTFSTLVGYPEYEINGLGVVRNLFGKVLMPFMKDGEKDREYLSLLDANGKRRTQQVARLLGLTFIPHPWTCEHLVVNHIDGNPMNNALSNLEWTTRARNNQHAFEEGLRSARGVLLKSCETGEIREFATIQRAAEFLGVARNALHVYLAAKVVRKFTPYMGWIPKYEDDPEPFGVVGSLETRQYALLNLNTMTWRRAETQAEASRITGISETSVQLRASDPSPRPWHGWMIKFIQTGQDPKYWPDYPPRIIELYQQMKNKCNPIKVTDLRNGKVTYHLGVKYWCRETNPGIDPAVLCRKLKDSPVWSHWSFEPFELHTMSMGTRAYPEDTSKLP